MSALATIRAVLAWRPKFPAIALPRPRLAPIVDAVEAVAGGAVEGISAAAGAAVRAQARRPRFALDAALACGGALLFLVLVLGSSWHAYRKGEAAQAAVAAAWQAKAVTAESLANGNADAAGRLHRAEARLAAEVDKHGRDNLASDARYAEALDAARRATESAKSARVACLPIGKGEGPPGSAPMTRSMRDALGVLRRGVNQ
ncbi:hypothetical protein ACLBX9_15935 [Methylobacterium sp. A49B]